MRPRQHKTASFLSAHPVFTRAEFAAAFGHPASAANVTSLLRHHLRAGNIKRVSREVFAAVPAHLAADRMVIDRFAAASKLRTDGVLGFHSALELHGITYSEFNEVQLISAGRTELVDLVELGVGYAMQLERGVKSENAVGPQFARRGEAVDHHSVRRQMGRDGGEHLAADALDVAGPQVMPEQAGDIGRARWMAEGGRELSPREDRVRREEAGRLVCARLHRMSTVLRQKGNIFTLSQHICQQTSLAQLPPFGR